MNATEAKRHGVSLASLCSDGVYTSVLLFCILSAFYRCLFLILLVFVLNFGFVLRRRPCSFSTALVVFRTFLPLSIFSIVYRWGSSKKIYVTSTRIH